MRTKFIILILISLILICGCIEETPQQSVDLTDYAKLSGRSGGQILSGGTNINENITIKGTSSPTFSNSFIKISPRLLISGSSGINSSTIEILQVGTTSSDPIKLGSWTNATAKNSPIVSNQYNSELEPRGFLIITGASSAEIINWVKIGGGANAYNTATNISFYTSLLTTTKMGIERMRITPNGNVSIGGIDPTSQFHTTETVRFAKYGAGTATFDAGGNITSVSDEKYKTNIVPFTSGLSAILNTNPKQFKYNAVSGLDTQNTYTGFVAQELQKSIPAAVYSKPDVKYEQILTKKATTVSEEDEYTTVEVPLGTNTLSIDDRAIIATLVNAVKEQQLQINDLKSRIDKLEGKKP